MRKTMLSS